MDPAEQGRNAGCWGSAQAESDACFDSLRLLRLRSAQVRSGQVAQHKIHAGDGTAPDAKARIMRAFLWVALGKGCIRMRQDRAERDVVQDTLFGFFSEKGGLKCDSVRRENYNKAFRWLGSENSRGGACDKLIRAVFRIQLVRLNNRLVKACRGYTSKLT